MKLNNSEIHIHFFKTESQKERFQELRDVLSSDERSRADKFRFNQARMTYVITRGMLRMLLAKYLLCYPCEIAFAYTEHGKPFLAGNTKKKPTIQFNVSHSHGGVCLGFARNAEIGVDIEKIRDRTSYQDIAKRFFATAEWEKLAQVPEQIRLETFLRIWTRKEAFIKACGVGLSYPLKDFVVPVNKQPVGKPYGISGIASALNGWSLYDLKAPRGYVAACAVAAKDRAVKCFF